MWNLDNLQYVLDVVKNGDNVHFSEDKGTTYKCLNLNEMGQLLLHKDMVFRTVKKVPLNAISAANSLFSVGVSIFLNNFGVNNAKI